MTGLLNTLLALLFQLFFGIEGEAPSTVLAYETSHYQVVYPQEIENRNFRVYFHLRNNSLAIDK